MYGLCQAVPRRFIMLHASEDEKVETKVIAQAARTLRSQ